MPRVPITEYAAKSLLLRDKIAPDWDGMQATSKTTAAEITKHFGLTTKLVVKVDQGEKKRGKRGLIKVNVDAKGVVDFVKVMSGDYSSFLIERLYPHTTENEYYLSLERVRDGYRVAYSTQGGIDIEEHWDSVSQYQWPRQRKEIPAKLHQIISSLVDYMDRYDISFCEINPLIVTDSGYVFLDCACLVDDVSVAVVKDSLLAAGIVPSKTQYKAEVIVKELASKTPASLKLNILNPTGRLWMLLSGGGASIVLADETVDLGYGTELANYGEYSGNPTTGDVYAYTRTILDMMLGVAAPKKALVIAGGVANFTDIAKTLRGVVQALDEKKIELKKQNVKIFVRRAGPNKAKGLNDIRQFLQKNDLYGEVADESMTLTDIVKLAVNYLK